MFPREDRQFPPHHHQLRARKLHLLSEKGGKPHWHAENESRTPLRGALKGVGWEDDTVATVPQLYS